MEFRTLAEGLQFPEGPVALNDGSVLLVEIAAGTLTRIAPDGTKSIAAKTGGRPERRRNRARRQGLYRQQWRLRVASRGRPYPAIDAGQGLQRRAPRTRRS